MQQLDLLDVVKEVYSETSGKIKNEDLYKRVAKKVGIPISELRAKTPIGKSKSLRSPLLRKIRWHQQTLKSFGLIEKSEERGSWELTKSGKEQLTKISPSSSMCIVAFSTKLGIAIWGNSENVFNNINEPISLCLTSPPYPIKKGRAYGSVDEIAYTDFICRGLEPIIRNLNPGGSIVLNVSNDIFEAGRPSRSIYLEKLIVSLVDRFGLELMDRLIWQSNKPPGPTYWCSIQRVQLHTKYEHVLWFTNDAAKVKSNNQRVLMPHTEAHLALIARGGENRTADYCDGAHRVRPGDYSSVTDGKIPGNVLQFSNTCHSQRLYKSIAREMGLPVHGAPMPLELAKFLIQFLVGDSNDGVVVDHYGGSLTVPLAAEILGVPWISADIIWEYLRGAAERFRDFDLALNDGFLNHESGFIRKMKNGV